MLRPEHICMHGLRLRSAIPYLRGMTRSMIALFTAALLTSTAAMPAQAQTPAASAHGVNAAQGGTTAAQLVGRTVRGRDGVVLGEVERVTLRRDGSPAQVLVRPKGPRPGGPRSLSYGSLRIESDGLSTPLTLAEFNAMPVIDVEAK